MKLFDFRERWREIVTHMAARLRSPKDHDDDRHGHERPVTQQDLRRLETLIMAAIDDLNAALAADTAAVTALIVAYGTPSATESQIAAVTAALNAQTAAVQAVLAPVAPPAT